jgi:GntR family transcriptional regulator
VQIDWNDKDPLYRQLHDRIVELIIEGVFGAGDALPSIREISSQHRINHITVAKGLQMLVDNGLIEKRRGLGMFVKEGARENLSTMERQRFLNEEWPEIQKKMERLDISSKFLLNLKNRTEKNS